MNDVAPRARPIHGLLTHGVDVCYKIRHSLPMRTMRQIKWAAQKAAHRAIPAIECEVCGTREGRLARHHRDHSKPLEVEVVCTTCHVILDQMDGFRAWRKPVACRICGATFAPARRTSSLCKRKECARAHGQWSASRRWSTHSKTKPCEWCNKVFEYTRRGKQTCGKICERLKAEASKAARRRGMTLESYQASIDGR